MPTGDAGVDAVFERAGAEVRAPGPAGEIDLDRAVEWHHAGGAVAAQNHRAQVTRVEPVLVDELTTRGDELVDGVLELHAVDAARVGEPLEVILEAEDRRAARRGIAADALERRRSELKRMTEDVNLRVRPRHELAVVPNPVGRRDLGHRVLGL